MARKKGKKSKNKSGTGGMLKNGIYAVKGAKNKGQCKESTTKLNKESSAAKTSIKKGAQMARIQKYAKENNITITQAMIKFM